MSKNRLIQFEYRTKNGVVEPKDCIVPVFVDGISIRGELTKKVFDPVKIGPVNMTGLFIVYEGIEYGSITTSLAQLLAEIQACSCVEDEFRLFDDEFDKEFE